jgi:hypothetical protein
MKQFPGLPGKILLLAALCVALLFAATLGAVKHVRGWLAAPAIPAARISKLPPLILWAWERPEQLQQLDARKVGVAFLARTIYLRSDRVVVQPRLQPLNVAPNTMLIAVARIESDQKERPSLNSAQMLEVAGAIAQLSRLPGVVAVQIDFDATRSERDFYRNLLFRVREELPQTTLLSITALASWCKGDNWLDDLPIDEAVPMLFRMGVESNQIRSQLAAGETFQSGKCQSSAGLSVDEPLASLPSTRRRYFFNPKSWSQESIETLLRNNQHEQQAP